MPVGKLIPLVFEREIVRTSSSAHIPVTKALIGYEVEVTIPEKEVLHRVVKPTGPSAHIYVPKKYAGLVARIKVIDYVPEESST